MNLAELMTKLETQAESVEFADVIAVIDELYDFTPSAFTNGSTQNSAGENNGSCKIFAFASLQGLNQEQTLACFGQYYRNDVLKHPNGDDHQNIRNFIQTGWDGISFQGQPLSAKA